MNDAIDYIAANSSKAGFNDPPKEIGSKKKKKPRLIPLELQNLFTRLQLLDCEAISTTDLTSKAFQWQQMDVVTQHDAHELNR